MKINNEIYNEIYGQIKKYALARESMVKALAFPDEEYEERVKRENINPDFARGNVAQSKIGLYLMARKNAEIEQDLWMILLKIAESK